jgi:misacylated tRNA(Ala) deacylase
MTEELFREDAYARSCAAHVVASVAEGVLLDRTVFYCAGGGQPGDRGRLAGADGSLAEVIDTVRADGAIVHRLAESARAPDAGAALVAEIDWSRRHRLMRMHSALHLLCAAAACPVTGGQIHEERSRLDFDAGARGLDKDALAEQIARWIAADHAIRHLWIDAAELEARPELVKTMSVRPPAAAGRVRLVEIAGVDLQACGGTHVRSTAEIGAVAIGKIENKGRQNRRVTITLAE